MIVEVLIIEDKSTGRKETDPGNQQKESCGKVKHTESAQSAVCTEHYGIVSLFADGYGDRAVRLDCDLRRSNDRIAVHHNDRTRGLTVDRNDLS